MSKKRIVVALGGNALGKTPNEQLELVKNTAKAIVSMAKEGYEVIVGHGNGPQVGMINLAMNSAKDMPYMPFAECGAMSQGYIGYHLQQAIIGELRAQGLNLSAASIITEVLVDKDDPAFKEPSKPVGRFYTKEEAEKLASERNFEFVEDSGRGYRRVVASPMPISIVELEVIKSLVKNDTIVIAAGGGGIPVIKDNDGNLQGVAAVIDKDRSSAKLALDLGADMLVILTAVDKVCINFNKPNQKELDVLTVSKAKEYIKNNEFGKGSMLPKVEACIDFVTKSKESIAIITSLENASEALKGTTGTKIERDITN